MLAHRPDRFFQRIACLFVERRDAQVADVLVQLPGHRFHRDDLAGEVHVERLGVFARDGQLDRCADGAAHAVDRVGEVKTDDALAVDGRQVVAGLYAALRRGRVVDRGDDFHDAVFGGDFDAEAPYSPRVWTCMSLKSSGAR